MTTDDICATTRKLLLDDEQEVQRKSAQLRVIEGQLTHLEQQTNPDQAQLQLLRNRRDAMANQLQLLNTDLEGLRLDFGLACPGQ
ncbi:hypothetical protein ABT095_05730 [Kitasatospora sp. NPDC002227]|uniref:hypothetical protein n=1 Tax=Kitasatospora sp. NPDC002227 TaxID=3154773 RepID=UPI00333338EA